MEKKKLTKGKFAHNKKVLLLPQGFQKLTVAEASRGVCMWERGKWHFEETRSYSRKKEDALRVVFEIFLKIFYLFDFIAVLEFLSIQII